MNQIYKNSVIAEVFGAMMGAFLDIEPPVRFYGL